MLPTEPDVASGGNGVTLAYRDWPIERKLRKLAKQKLWKERNQDKVSIYRRAWVDRNAKKYRLIRIRVNVRRRRARNMARAERLKLTQSCVCCAGSFSRSNDRPRKYCSICADNAKKASSASHYAAHRADVLLKAKIWAARNPARVKAINKRFYVVHKNRINERCSAYQKAHPEVGRKAYHRWASRNPEKVLTKRLNQKENQSEWGKRWRKANPELARNKGRAYGRLRVSNLSDYYVRATLARSIGLRAADISPEIVELKRKHLMALRLLGKTPKKKVKTHDISANRQ